MSAVLGEIRLFAGDFAPEGWAVCDGAPLSVDEHETLFALLSTTYGGDGKTTFNLPDMVGKLPTHGLQAGAGQVKPAEEAMDPTGAGLASLGLLYIICVSGAFPELVD